MKVTQMNGCLYRRHQKGWLVLRETWQRTLPRSVQATRRARDRMSSDREARATLLVLPMEFMLEITCLNFSTNTKELRLAACVSGS